jgi:hypothetical protein
VAWIVRVSVADITTDGPFSAYPGVERWFAVLDGGGVELNDANGAVRLRAGDAIHRFRGSTGLPAARRVNARLQPDATARCGHGDDHGAANGPRRGVRLGGCAASPLRARLAGNEGWKYVPAGALAWTTAPARLQIDAGPLARGWRIDVTLAKEERS